MDISTNSCIYEQDLDDLLFNGDSVEIMNAIEELAAALGDDFQTTPATSPESVDSALTGKRSPSPCPERHVKQRKIRSPAGKPDPITADLSSSSSPAPAPAPVILSFGPTGDLALKPEIPAETGHSEAKRKISGGGGGGGGGGGRSSKVPSNTYDHIMAERKRRQLLSQHFQDLSTIVPGLKKMDKTSVLGDTVKYLRQLQDRVKNLEEQQSKQTIKSNVYVRKSQTLIDDESEGSSYACDDSSSEQSLPEIETRVSDGHILLRIYCEKHAGVLTKIFTEVDKFNLAVTNTSVSHFGSLALDITIIAQMEKENDLPIKDLVKGLRAALQHAMSNKSFTSKN